MARLNRIWHYNTISFASKFKLYKSLVTSILLYRCETWTPACWLKKGIQAFKTKCMRNFSVSPTWCTVPTTGCGARSLPCWQLSRDGNLHHLGLSHTTTASLKPFFRASWGWRDEGWHWSAEEMLDGQHQRVEIPALARTAHKSLLQKRLEWPNDPIDQGTELNWTVLGN